MAGADRSDATREVAEVVGVEERTVQRWLAWYRAGGLAEVEGRHAHGKGAAPFLTVEQQAELAGEVETGRFRTGAEVRRWVEDRWGVRYTEGGMYALLGRLDCAPKVPRPVHEKADHLAQARWEKTSSVNPFGEQNRKSARIGASRLSGTGKRRAAGRLSSAAWVDKLRWEGRASRRP